MVPGMIPPNIRNAACCARSLRGTCLKYGAMIEFDQICDDFEWLITG